GGDHHGVDAVHDAFIVRCSTIGVELGEPAGRDDPVAHARTVPAFGGQALDGHAPGDPHAATVGQVRQDAQPDLRAGQLGQAIGHRLGVGVDQVGTHRVAHVDVQVHRHHAGAGRALRLEDVHLEAATAAPARP